MTRGVGTALLVALLTWTAPATAADVSAGDDPVRLDVTETSVAAQRFAARGGESPLDQGYGSWLNRLNAALSLRRLTVGVRLDSSVYWLRPSDGDLPPSLVARADVDRESRYRDAIYPAKLWATYQAPGLEVTLGDAYVQFGRGLVLSMRKIDELGVDTTLRGAKVAWQADPFAVTVVAGIANPNRVDEVAGRALFLPLGDDPRPLYGADRIVGAEIQAGRGLPVTLTTHAARLNRCAPAPYDAQGRVDTSPLAAPLGACSPSDTSTWLSSLPASGSLRFPVLDADEITNLGQGIELPDLAGHGQIYLEGAAQNRRHAGANDPQSTGNALYASATVSAGAITETLELKSYRNFYPLAGAVDLTRAAEFNNVVYSTPPTTELITQDSEFGDFNACVNGGRLRSDLRASSSFLAYATVAYFRTQSEQPAGGCDALGRVVTSGVAPARGVTDDVEDVVLGEEWTFDRARSHLYASLGARNDTYEKTGDPFYREWHVEYTFAKHLGGPYSIEIAGRHRYRYEASQNLGNYWSEGENYVALKVAPKWVFTQGVEYTTFTGLSPLYWNGALLYRFSGANNLKLFVGQQRAGLKCISGVCKMFPAFEGARVEVTLRF
ncbi:MAG TPA: DUF6029 family protein [Polyangiaceae bacterium]